MKKLIRISITVFFVTLSTYISAQTFKIATVAPDGTTWMKELRKGAKEVSEKTEGRVKFKFYPGGVMGSARSVLRKIRIRQLHGGAFLSSELADVYPDIQAYGLPFMFNSYAEVDYVRSKIDESLKSGLEEKGYVALGLSEGGFGYMMSNSPLHTIDDIRGQKVWLPEGDKMAHAVFDVAGINPIPLPISDVYTAMQTGMVETIAGTPMGTIAFQWHTAATYLTDVPLAYLIGILAVDKKAFKKLKSEDKKTLRTVMGRVFKRLDRLNREDNINAKQALENQGMKFIMPTPDEVKRWKLIGDRAIQKLLDEQVISNTTYDKISQSLKEYRLQN